MTRKKTATKSVIYEESLREPLVPKTKGQSDYIRTILENDITFCIGPAGSSKSYTAIALGCQGLLEKRYDKLIIARPAVEASGKSRGLGYLKGDLSEKMSPYVFPAVEHMKRFLSTDKYYNYIRNDSIRFESLEYCRGRTFDYSYIIGEEFQNADTEQIKMFVSRIGKDSKMVINGDLDQSDLKRNNNDQIDLEYVLKKVESHNLDGFGVVRLTKLDIVRNPRIAQFLEIF